jgi:putative effector of murein hydrolase LrgA (UPF0299 family)
MLNYLTLIFGCQLIGELVTRALTIPVPGPVLGMVILFFVLVLWGTIPEKLSTAADGLLNHLSLLFVPAGVGVMLHFRLLGDDWLAITVALVLSTVLTIVVTALMMSWLAKHTTTPGGTGIED